MHDTLLVGMVETFGNLRDDVGCRAVMLNRAVAADEFPQIAARHVFRDKEIHIAVVARVDGPDQLRMVGGC